MLKVDINSVSLLDEEKRRTILQNIKFDIEKGKVYTILGKNGSGKSTLIKSLDCTTAFRTLSKFNGKVLFNGHRFINHH